MTKASLNGTKVFSQSAIKRIVAESQGIPRIINILCDNALITGFGYQKKRITNSVAEEVIADFKGERKPAPATSLSRFEVGFFAAVMILFLAGAFSLYLHGRNFMSTLDVRPELSMQEKVVSQGAENTGHSITGKISATRVETKPLVKQKIPRNR